MKRLGLVCIFAAALCGCAHGKTKKETCKFDVSKWDADCENAK